MAIIFGMEQQHSASEPYSARKAEAFRRLATQRTNAILEKLRLLGNLSNRASYQYTDEEVKRIFEAIQRELKDARNKFDGLRGEKKFEL